VFRDFIAKGQGGIVLFEALFFLAVLGAGLAYVWGRGDLEWVRTFLGEKKHDEKRAC
jgi:NADH-quinone oxidoreductase subunit A